MTWKEYEIEAAKFDKVPYRSQAEQFAHGVLGFMSEMSEVELADRNYNSRNTKEELGDMCWYASRLTTLTGYDPITYSRNSTYDYSNTANVVKRWMFGNKPLSESEINHHADRMFRVIAHYACEYGLKLEDILVANIAKLNLRTQNATKAYTEVVDESARDRAAEAKLME